jgi:hypothetical protein
VAAGATYSTIATTTLSSASSSVTFSSIPGTYTDLVIVTNPGSSSGSIDARLRFNTDTGTNYSLTVLRGSGTAASSFRISNQSFIDLNSLATIDTTIRQNTIINIMNYANSTTYKTLMCRANNASAGTDAIVGLWRSTAAITAVEIYASTANFASGSSFSLYGIASA